MKRLRLEPYREMHQTYGDGDGTDKTEMRILIPHNLLRLMRSHCQSRSISMSEFVRQLVIAEIGDPDDRADATLAEVSNAVAAINSRRAPRVQMERYPYRHKLR